MLYASLVAHSYLLAMFFSIAQVATLGALVIAYIPGGSAGLRMMASTATHAVSSAFGR